MAGLQIRAVLDVKNMGGKQKASAAKRQPIVLLLSVSFYMSGSWLDFKPFRTEEHKDENNFQLLAYLAGLIPF
jgi:hypothetical protein